MARAHVRDSITEGRVGGDVVRSFAERAGDIGVHAERADDVPEAGPDIRQLVVVLDGVILESTVNVAPQALSRVSAPLALGGMVIPEKDMSRSGFNVLRGNTAVLTGGR